MEFITLLLSWVHKYYLFTYTAVYTLHATVYILILQSQMMLGNARVIGGILVNDKRWHNLSLWREPD